MFENLILSELKGLKECELPNLGQINLVCGKNNSGKSTVLEAINNSSNRSHGKLFTFELTDQLFNRTVGSFPFRDNEQHRLVYKDIIKSIMPAGSIWYENRVDEFVQTLRQAYTKSVLLPFQIPIDSIKIEYAELIVKKLNTLLIPPKRALELSKNIQANDKIEPNGGGILNQLFYYKNQPEETDGKKTYHAIREHFLKISSGCDFDIYMNGQNVAVLNFLTKGSSNWIKAANCGLGLQDLLVILWFSISPTIDVLLIEEPESHLHPEMQRKLLEFLRSQTNKQFFLSSHSNVFVNSAYADKIFYTQPSENINVVDATNRVSVLSDLGYSVADNLVSDLGTTEK